MQYQVIVDRVAGLEPRFTGDDLNGYLRLVWDALDRCGPGEAARAICETPGSIEVSPSTTTFLDVNVSIIILMWNSG